MRSSRRPRPLGPLHDVAGELGGEVEALLRADGGRPHDVFAAVAARLRSDQAVLVVDDLHWADDATIELLRFLLRRLGTTRSLVIGAARIDEVEHPLRALLGDMARSPDTTTVDVPPLSETAIAELVGDRPLDAAELFVLTGGNPFFVNEMLDHAGEDLPATVRDAVLARTVGLGDQASRSSTSWPAHRRGFPIRCCRPWASAFRRYGDCTRRTSSVGRQSGVTFRHDLVRLAVESALPPGGEVAFTAASSTRSRQRRALTLPFWPTTPLVRVTRKPSCASASEAGRAAARSGAHTQAATLFDLALEHAQHVTLAEEATLLEQLAPEHYLTDHLPEAISAIRRVRRRLPGTPSETSLG